jgi:hypothetical protein
LGERARIPVKVMVGEGVPGVIRTKGGFCWR